MKIKHPLIRLLFIGFIITGCSDKENLQNPDGAVHLHIDSNVRSIDSKWYFIADDKMEYAKPGISLKGWDFLYPHFSWTTVKKYRNYRGNGWYRIDLFIEGDIHDSALLAYRQYRGTQFYLNGDLLYETSPFNEKGESPPIIGKPSFIPIPANRLQQGRNVLCCRTAWLDDRGGLANKLVFGEYRLVEKRWLFFNYWYCSLAVINLFLAFYFLLYFLNRRGETYYFYFSGLALFLGMWIAGFKGIVLWLVDSQWLYVVFTYIGSIAASYMGLNFIQSFLQIKKNIFSRIFVVFFLSLASFVLLELVVFKGLYYFHRYLYEIYIQSLTLLLIYYVVMCVQGIRQRKPYARRMFIGLSIFMATYVVSVFSFLEIVDIDSYVLEGFFAMTVVFATILASRFTQVHSDLERSLSDLIIINKLKDEAMSALNIYKHIVSSSRDHMAFIDRGLHIAAANEAFCRAHRKKLHAITGSPLEAAIGRKEFSSMRNSLDLCLTGRIVVFEKWRSFPKLGERYMTTTLYPHIADTGQINGIVYNAVDNTERVRIEKELVSISENERRMIGMELHDRLAQNLLNIEIKTNMLSSNLERHFPDGCEHSREIESLLNDAINDTRSLARGLFPVSIEAGGFSVFFEELRHRMVKTHNIRLVTEFDERVGTRDMMTTSQLYYIIQEAVTNAVKHARADVINIALKQVKNDIVLIVRDNGIGIPERSEGTPGVGLSIMRYRARMIGALLSIRKCGERGTEIRCVLKNVS